MKPFHPILICAVGMFSALGCSSSRPSTAEYQTPAKDSPRQLEAAQAENAKALELIASGKLADAETTLKHALSIDVMYGPAHNNLGKVYYSQGKLYLAAWEFQYAQKLMPNQPEPFNNLGLVFEAAGKLDDATEWYTKAMNAEPDNAQFIGNLARARLRRGDPTEQVADLLHKLVIRDTRPEWIAWAKERLALMPRSIPN